MPLDTGAVTQNVHLSVGADGDERPTADIISFSPDSTAHVGEALRAARERRGLGLQEVADATRIRRTYLDAIERLDLEQLPSRPFVIGYVRAYAKMLGLDDEAAAQRFKIDAPDEEQTLRAPVGVRKEGDPRLAMIAVGGAVVVAAIIAWNVAQRAMAQKAPPPAVVAETGVKPPPPAVPAAPVALGAPLPAPVESTVPPPYVTPGLEAATANGGAVPKAGGVPASAPAARAPTPAIGAPFKADGPIYGAPATASTLILQANKPASIIIRGADGSVYFARQFAAGEAYRVPNVKGLTADVSEPEAFDVFVGGALKGELPAPQTALAKLAD